MQVGHATLYPARKRFVLFEDTGWGTPRPKALVIGENPDQSVVAIPLMVFKPGTQINAKNQLFHNNTSTGNASILNRLG